MWIMKNNIATTLNNLQTKYLTIYQFLACFCLFIIIFNKVFAFAHIDINILRHLAKNLCYLFVALNLIVFIKEKNFLVIILSLLFLIVGVLNKKYSLQTDVLQYSILVIAFSKLNFKFAIKTFLLTVGFLIVSIMFYSLLDLSNNQFFGVRDGVLRQAFGFRHSNFLGGMIFFFIMTLWTYTKDKLLNNMLCIALLIAEYLFIEHYIDSRTAQVMCLLASLMIVGYIILKSKQFNLSSTLLPKTASILAVNFILIFAVVHIFVVYLYSPNSEFFVALDNLFSSRISLQNNALQNFSISMFGDFAYARLVDTDPLFLNTVSSRSYNLLDSFYFYVLYRWGLMSLLVFLISTVLISWKALNHGQYKILIALICFSIYAINENFYFMICYNIFIYMCFSDLSSGEKISCQKSQC